MVTARMVFADMWRVFRRVNKSIVRHCIGILEPPSSGGLQLERMGTDYGGWWLPAQYMKAGKVYYGVGVGLDISYDLCLAREKGLSVYLFDPTPMAIDYYRNLCVKDSNIQYIAKGLWDADTTLTFFEPRDARAPSHSVFDLGGTSKGVDAEVRSLPSLMRELGHDRVDILKIDIEGSWNRVIDGFREDDPLPDVLQVEFDSPTNLLRVRRAIRKLKRLGYRFIHRERDNYLFIRSNPEGS